MRKKILTLGAMMASVIGLFAQSTPLEQYYAGLILGNSGGIKVDLWTGSDLPSNGVDYNNLPERSLETKPFFELFIPQSDEPLRLVIVCPGGGYVTTATIHEGTMWRNYFEQQGMATAVLNYRMPHGNHQVPASDVYAAIRYVRQHARELNVDPDQIGIMGFSAGGHLASTVATHAPDDLLPAFQILLYPVITMDATYTHRGSRENLIGPDPTDDLVERYSNELQVSNRTPRAFIALAADDETVPPLNAARYYEALTIHGVPSVLHVYPTGGHGFGMLTTFKYQTELLLELSGWLRSF